MFEVEVEYKYDTRLSGEKWSILFQKFTQIYQAKNFVEEAFKSGVWIVNQDSQRFIPSRDIVRGEVFKIHE